jgi:hypothetical protein
MSPTCAGWIRHVVQLLRATAAVYETTVEAEFERSRHTFEVIATGQYPEEPELVARVRAAALVDTDPVGINYLALVRAQFDPHRVEEVPRDLMGALRAYGEAASRAGAELPPRELSFDVTNEEELRRRIETSSAPDVGAWWREKLQEMKSSTEED